MRHRPAVVVLALLAALTAGCGGDDAPPPVPTADPDVPAVPSPSGTPLWPASFDGLEVEDTVASGLAAPSAVAFLPDDDGALVAERDSGRVVLVAKDGRTSEVGTVPGVAAGDGGGLLGLAVKGAKVYAYLTTGSDNRVVKLPLDDGRLGAPETVVDDLPAGEGVNGGGLAIGPDGKLYVGTGEGDASGAQDRDDLGGKVLRLNLDGTVPKDNPFRGSPVWTLGHRDVAGLAFDSDGGLWATETGQDKYQELNRIRRGENYGWPRAEGKAADEEYERAHFAWRDSDEASPQGLAIVKDDAYVADLRGGKLWKLPLKGGADSGEAFFGGLYGPLRTVALSPSGDLWLATAAASGSGSGSGDPGGGDAAKGEDRVIRLSLED